MMIQTMRQTYDIQIVQSVQPCDGGVRLVFPDGLSGCVSKDRPEFERIVRSAQSSVHYGTPVGLLANNAGEIVELSPAHLSTVRFANQDEDDPSRLVVGFWAYNPICYLTRDHPEFNRIRETLLDAVRTGGPIFLVNHMNMVEGETETWWKLLDVRAAQPHSAALCAPAEHSGLPSS